MRTSEEQMLVVESEAPVLVVNAYAGSGKTYSLTERAKRNPGKKMLYLAYNTANKVDAKKKFPANVTVMTTHGMAYPEFGAPRAFKNRDLKIYHVAEFLSVETDVASAVLSAVNKFMASSDFEIGEKHFSGFLSNTLPVGQLIGLANRVWDSMTDTAGQTLNCPHDAYLKLFHLHKRTVRSDVREIMLDEAQDTNPCVLDIILRQNCDKVIVGDQYQSMYAFRGAVNALSQIEADERLYLTKSFRFGHGIGALASLLLKTWRGEKRPLVGAGSLESVFGTVSLDKPHARISRSNAFVFRNAIELSQANIPFGFVGKIEGYRLDLILDVYRLYLGRIDLVVSPMIRYFKSYSNMTNYATQVDDRELKLLSQVVDEFGSDIPRLVEEIKTKARPLSGAEVALTTAHKSKGLDWLNVVLDDDFVELEYRRDRNNRLVGPGAEEVNILYVAMTRAVQGLQLPKSVLSWLVRDGCLDILGDQEACSKSQDSEEKVRAPRVPEMLDVVSEIERQIEILKGIVQNNAPEMASSVAELLNGYAKDFSEFEQKASVLASA